MPLSNGAVSGFCGPVVYNDGDYPTTRAGKSGEMIVGMAHATFYEAVYRGNCFVATNTAAITFGTTLTLTGVTFHLYNPLGSGKNLVILKSSVNIITCTTSGTIFYVVNNVPTATAPATVTTVPITNALIGNASVGVAKAYSVATLPAIPTPIRPLAGGIATAANLAPTTTIDWVDGEFLVAPGCVLSVQGLTIAGTGIIGMSWEEVNQ